MAEMNGQAAFRRDTVAERATTAGGNPVKAGVPEMRRMYEAALAGRL